MAEATAVAQDLVIASWWMTPRPPVLGPGIVEV